MLQNDGLKTRFSAFGALVDWRKTGKLLREHSLSPFAKELALGVCRRHLRLLHAIRKSVRRMPGLDVQCVLEMGIYQMFFMDVPNRAVIDSSAELAPQANLGEGSVKLVNGILRRLDRYGLPSLPPQNVLRLSLEYSMPEWLVRRLLDCCGPVYAEEFSKETVERPSQWMRVNVQKISAEELQKRLALSGRIYKNRFIEIPEGNPHLGELLASKEFKEGFFSIQNPAALEVVNLLQIQDGMSVWDACAAPGGKSALLAEMYPHAEILASDISAERLLPMQDLHSRLSLSNISVQTLDVTAHSFFERFDRILLDVPCSNLGVLSRRPEVKYRLSLKDVLDLSKIQFHILETAVSALKKNGILVYATCSPEPVETDKVVKKFLEAHPDFEQVGLPVRISKNEFGLDRFFAAALRKK